MSSSQLRAGCSLGGTGLSQAEPPTPGFCRPPRPWCGEGAALAAAGIPAGPAPSLGFQGLGFRVSQLIPTLPLTSLKAPACSGLGASWGWGPGPGDRVWGPLPACTVPSGSRLSQLAFHLLQPRGGKQGGRQARGWDWAKHVCSVIPGTLPGRTEASMLLAGPVAVASEQPLGA